MASIALIEAARRAGKCADSITTTSDVTTSMMMRSGRIANST